MMPLKKSEQPANSETLNCSSRANFFHSHTFGKTFFIEQKAGIVAAYVDNCAKRTTEAKDAIA
jgi:hypothetical protein